MLILIKTDCAEAHIDFPNSPLGNRALSSSSSSNSRFSEGKATVDPRAKRRTTTVKKVFMISGLRWTVRAL